MRGEIAADVRNSSADVMPYDYIFIPEGLSKTISEISADEKNKRSHRGVAFRKFGEYVRDNFS